MNEVPGRQRDALHALQRDVCCGRGLLVAGHLPDSFSPRVTSPGGTNACLLRRVRGRATVIGDGRYGSYGDDEPARPREVDTACDISSTASSTHNSFGGDAVAALTDVCDGVTLDLAVRQLELVYDGT